MSWLRRARNLLQFRLEQFLLLGTHARLAFIAATLALVSITAGLLAGLLDPALADPREGVWWAFLRLSDPGYLGDDEGSGRRFVSTVVTVAGYVLFMGALVATMTQWLNQTIRKLESGFTPLAADGHIVLVGWTPSTPDVLREILSSRGRVRRFLERRKARRLHLVLLIDDFEPELVYEIRAQLGPLYSRARITPRSGSALRLEHLERVDFSHASAIVIPADRLEDGGADPDIRTIKALLSVGAHARSVAGGALPFVVVELRDPRKIPAALAGYRGELEVLASDQLVARLFLKSMLEPGLGGVIDDILTHGEGNALYARDLPELVGEPFGSLGGRFPEAIPLGVVRRDAGGTRCLLAPPPATRVAAGDRLVLLARDYDDTEPGAQAQPPTTPDGDLAQPASRPPRRPPQRLLVLGWNRKVARLAEELAGYRPEALTIDVLSEVPLEEREPASVPSRATIRHLLGDYATANGLGTIDPSAYDTVVLVGSDLLESGADTDARTIVGYLLLRDRLASLPRRPHVIVELLDPNNHELLDGEPVEILVSSAIVGRTLAQVTLRPELGSVYETLFGATGPDIVLREAAAYGADAKGLPFGEVSRRIATTGHVLLGHFTSRGGDVEVVLNPPRDVPLPDGAGVVVLADDDED